MLTLATYNIKDFFSPKAPADEAHFGARATYLAERIAEVRPDVLALQEVGEPEALDALLQALGALSLGYHATVGTPDDRGIRCAVLSALPVEHAHVHTREALPFPVLVEGDSPPFGTRIPLQRGIVEVQVATEWGNLHVFSAHWKSNLPRFLRDSAGTTIAASSSAEAGEAVIRSGTMRAAEALFLRQLADERLARPGSHVAIMGDFNDDRKSVGYKVVCGAGKAELFGAFQKVKEHKRYSSIHRGKPVLIDHIMVSEGLWQRMQSADIDTEHLEEHPYPAAPGQLFVSSDHAIVSARFSPS
jgi:endonuclease/exonuclease/phosphatase family metal-dependent hydrolase